MLWLGWLPGAVNVETARVAEQVKGELQGRMRLQWVRLYRRTVSAGIRCADCWPLDYRDGSGVTLCWQPRTNLWAGRTACTALPVSCGVRSDI